MHLILCSSSQMSKYHVWIKSIINPLDIQHPPVIPGEDRWFSNEPLKAEPQEMFGGSNTSSNGVWMYTVPVKQKSIGQPSDQTRNQTASSAVGQFGLFMFSTNPWFAHAVSHRLVFASSIWWRPACHKTQLVKAFSTWKLWESGHQKVWWFVIETQHGIYK